MTRVPHTVSVSRTIAATPATLYAAWTEPDRMRRWFATVVDADVRVGGHYRIELHEADLRVAPDRTKGRSTRMSISSGRSTHPATRAERRRK